MEIVIPDDLNEEWKYSSKNTSLPKELVLFCWHLGISGERVYIPVRESRLKVATRKLLGEMERAYMEDCCTFFLEEKAEALFSERFGARKVQKICGVATKTALEISRRAYNKWRYWFEKKEEPRLKELIAIAMGKGVSYNELNFYYIKTRQQLREGMPISVEYYCRNNIFPLEIAESMTALARQSAQDCKWSIAMPENIAEKEKELPTQNHCTLKMPEPPKEKPLALRRSIIKEEFMQLTGNIIEAVILTQFEYWQRHVPDVDKYIDEEMGRLSETHKDISDNQPNLLSHGWLKKTAEELAKEIALDTPNYKTLRYINSLVGKGYLLRRRPGRVDKLNRTSEYRLDLKKISEDLKKLGIFMEIQHAGQIERL